MAALTNDQIRQKAYALEDKGASAEDIEEFVRLAKAEQGAGDQQASRVAPSAYGIGTMPVDNAKVADMTVDTARYGPSIIAGMLTGGPGAAPAMAATRAVTTLGPRALELFQKLAATFGSGVLGESAAQRMEKSRGTREEYSLRDVGAAGVTSTMGTPLKVASGGTRVGANVVANVLAGEAGLTISEKGWSVPEGIEDVAVRFGVPAVIGGASVGGAKAGQIAEVQQGVARISEERFMEAGRGVFASEVMKNKPWLSRYEQQFYKDNIAIARKTLDDLNVGVSDVVFESFAKNGLMDESIAVALTPHLNEANKAREAALAARNAYDKAVAKLNDFKAISPNSEEIRKANEAANTFAAEKLAAEDIYRKTLDKLFGSNVPTVADAGSAGGRGEWASEKAAVLDGQYESARNKLYSQIEVGINDPVVSKDDFIDALKAARKRDGAALAGDKAFARVMAKVGTEFGATEKPKDFIGFLKLDGGEAQPQTLSKEAFLNFKNAFAKELANESEFADSANKIAAEAYVAMLRASDAYVSKTYGPDVALAIKNANEVMRGVYQSRATEAMELLRDGKIDRFTDLVLEQGKGAAGKPEEGRFRSIWGQIEDYLAAGSRLGTSASEEAATAASGTFMRDLGQAMKESIASRSLDAASSATSPMIDMAKFTAKLQTLQNQGFNLSFMGIDKPEYVTAARSIAESLQGGALSPKQLDRFIDDAATLGVPRAKTEFEARKLAREYKIANLAGKRNNEEKLILDLRRKAGGLKEADAKLAEAESDPLVRLLSDTSLKLSKDPVLNTEWITRLSEVGPVTARQFMDALAERKMTDTISSIRLALMSRVFMDHMAKDATAATKNGYRIKTDALTEYFFNPKNDARYRTIKAIMGDGEEASRLYDLVGRIKRMEEQSRRVMARPFQSEAIDVARAGGGLFGAVRDVGIWAWTAIVRSTIRLAQQGRYKTLHMLYIDPFWSKKFEAAGRNMEKFLQNPANAVAYRLAQQQDDEAEAERAAAR